MVQIIFMRHGEKSKGKHLSDEGYLRAIYLADYILHPFGLFEIPQMLYIMEMKNSKKSVRCFETMKPIIDKGIPYMMIPRHTTETFAKSLLKDTHDTVLVCYEHERILDIVNILGISVDAWGFDPESDRDDDTCFDATWVVDIVGGTKTLTVYKQFDIRHGQPYYTCDRNKIWFQKTYTTMMTPSCTIS